MFKNINYLRFVLAILVSQAAGIVGSVFTISAIPTWYAALNKPFFNPPNYIFGPVWITLYTIMGVTLYLVWVSKSKNKTLAYKFFFVQLMLNTLWSIVFFGLQNPQMAFYIIIILLVTIAGTIYHFYKISKVAGIILVPYLVWVCFASLLNYAIWQLNP